MVHARSRRHLYAGARWDSVYDEGMLPAIRIALIVAATASLLSCSASPEDPALEALLEKGVAHGYPGMAAMVIDGRGVVRAAAAAGYSDLEHHTPLRVDDSFHLASITKTFTAVATLRLVDAGKLALTATLKDVLGDAVNRVPNAAQITVEELLDHSSGIYPTNNDMDYLTTVIGPQADPHRVWKAAELVALADAARQAPTAAPGAGHHYSDTNYVLLGMIVEKVAGRPYKQYIEETIFAPLEMRSTYFYSDSLDNAAGTPPVRTVQGYLLATEDVRSAIDINPMFQAVPGDTREGGALLNTTLAAERIDAAAGIVTKLSDLARYATALFHGKLLSPRSQAFLMAVGAGMETQDVGTQRIWALQAVRKPEGVLLYKEGDGPGGVNTLMAYLPAQDEIFLGFTNVFGYFDEIDFLMDEVIAPFVAAQ
jgi:D-alanyl-D-alanine carboxypeptidase